MEGILLTCKSVTHAQRIRKILINAGVPAAIVRPDIELTKRNCAYAVNISQGYLGEAIETLKYNRVLPNRTMLIESDGSYREIYI